VLEGSPAARQISDAAEGTLLAELTGVPFIALALALEDGRRAHVCDDSADGDNDDPCWFDLLRGAEDAVPEVEALATVPIDRTDRVLDVLTLPAPMTLGATVLQDPESTKVLVPALQDAATTLPATAAADSGFEPAGVVAERVRQAFALAAAYLPAAEWTGHRATRALALLRSRAFETPELGPLVVPFADCFNHGGPSLADFSVDLEAGEFVVETRVPYAAGDEVFITYGCRHLDSFLNYGFCLNDDAPILDTLPFYFATPTGSVSVWTLSQYRPESDSDADQLAELAEAAGDLVALARHFDRVIDALDARDADELRDPRMHRVHASFRRVAHSWRSVLPVP
jgi:hypothetical protein